MKRNWNKFPSPFPNVWFHDDMIWETCVVCHVYMVIKALPILFGRMSLDTVFEASSILSWVLLEFMIEVIHTLNLWCIPIGKSQKVLDLGGHLSKKAIVIPCSSDPVFKYPVKKNHKHHCGNWVGPHPAATGYCRNLLTFVGTTIALSFQVQK